MIKDAENNLQKLIKIFPKNKKGKAEYKLIEAQIPNIKKILNVE